MKIGTWNVNGIRAREAQFREWLEREKPDAVCLQEIKAGPLQIPPPVSELADYWCYWYGLGGYSGVALHMRKDRFPEKPVFCHPSFDHENRIVAACSGDLTIASIYVPNGGKDFPAKMRFLKAMEEYAAEEHGKGHKLILCGDLNVAHKERDVHPKERKPNAIGQLPEEREQFSKILSRGLVDVGRAMDPNNDNLFTWWAPWRNMRQRNIGWRLDYILTTESIAQKTSECRVQAEVGTSDHAPVLGIFDI